MSPLKVFRQFRLDTCNQCLWRIGNMESDERIPVAPKAFAVLEYLVEHAGRLVTQEELLEHVWRDRMVEPQAVKKRILDVRNALGDHPKNPVFIETVPKRGYRFIAPVSKHIATSPSASVRASQGMLVGRNRALTELHGGLRQASSGERKIVFITGEAGIGKTALADEFRRQSASTAACIRMATGQCVEGYGGKEPYYPMLDALGRLCAGPQADSIVQVLAAQAPTWLVQFPALLKREHREMLQREILGTTRERMLREICEALETITAEFPDARHGLFRYWDIADPNSPRVRHTPDVTSILLDSQPASYQMLWEDGERFRVAKIGDADQYLNAGTHVYEIRYAIDGVLDPASTGADKTFAESTGAAVTTGSVFYWNVIPPAWNNRIQRADISITLPGAVPRVRLVPTTDLSNRASTSTGLVAPKAVAWHAAHSAAKPGMTVSANRRMFSREPWPNRST